MKHEILMRNSFGFPAASLNYCAFANPLTKFHRSFQEGVQFRIRSFGFKEFERSSEMLKFNCEPIASSKLVEYN